MLQAKPANARALGCGGNEAENSSPRAPFSATFYVEKFGDFPSLDGWPPKFVPSVPPGFAQIIFKCIARISGAHVVTLNSPTFTLSPDGY